MYNSIVTIPADYNGNILDDVTTSQDDELTEQEQAKLRAVESPHKPDLIGTSKDEISRFVSHLTMPVELRIPKTARGIYSGYFDNRETLINEIICLSEGVGGLGKIESVYVTLNPVSNDLLARSYNHGKAYAKETTGDVAIQKRIWLPIDCDAKKPAGVMANPQERKAAIKSAEEIKNYLTSAGFPDPIFSDSGNGGHLLYRIDLPNDIESNSLIETLIKTLCEKFPNAGLDKTVFNASRIWKVYGTWVRKGDDVLDRRHRVAQMLRYPDALEVVGVDLIKNVIASIGQAPVAKEIDNVIYNGSFNLDEFLQKYNIEVRNVVDTSEGKKYVLDHCPFNPDHTGKDAAIFTKDGKLCFKCFHNSCSDKHWKDVRELFEPEAERSAGKAKPIPSADDIANIIETSQARNVIQPSTNVKPAQAVQPVKRRRQRVLDTELDLLPDPEPLVQDFIDVESLNCFFGPSNAGKSFIALDLANSVARGIPFLEKYKVFQSMPVAYIYAEGRRGLKMRMKGWRKARKQEPTKNLVYLPYSFIINDDDGAELLEVIEEAKDGLGQFPKLLIVDTLSKNMQGNQDSTADMSAMVNRLSGLVTSNNMTVIVIHHTGKDEDRGARGSNTLRCGLDNEFKVYRQTNDTIAIKSEKAREAETGKEVICRQRLIELGIDKYGRKLTTLVLSASHEDQLPEDQQGHKADVKDDMRKILSVLTEKEASSKSIATEIVMTRQKVNRLLEIMRNEGLVNYTERLTKNNVKSFFYTSKVGIEETF